MVNALANVLKEEVGAERPLCYCLLIWLFTSANGDQQPCGPARLPGNRLPYTLCWLVVLARVGSVGEAAPAWQCLGVVNALHVVGFHAMPPHLKPLQVLSEFGNSESGDGWLAVLTRPLEQRSRGYLKNWRRVVESLPANSEDLHRIVRKVISSFASVYAPGFGGADLVVQGVPSGNLTQDGASLEKHPDS